MKFKVVWAKDIPKLGIKEGDDGEKQINEFILLQQKEGCKWCEEMYWGNFDGFLINQEGQVKLDDGCGRHVWVPDGLFKVEEVEE